MVDNLYVMEQLARERINEQLNAADRRRLQRRAADSARAPASNSLADWLLNGSAATPAPKRA